MANLFFILSCLGLMVSVVSGEDTECAPPSQPPSPSQMKEESKCCQMPRIDIQMSFREECFKELKAAHPEFEKKHHHPHSAESKNARRCFEQCVFKKRSLLDDDNKLKHEAIREDGERNITGEWKEIGAKAVDECLEAAPAKVPEDAECKSGSFEFTMCVKRHLFMNCPAAKWTDSEVCKAAKARLEKCSDMPPPPPFHHHHHHGPDDHDGPHDEHMPPPPFHHHDEHHDD